MQLAVIDRRATQFDTQCASASGHHRTGIRTVPGRSLRTPATQRQSGLAQQGVGQCHKTCGNVVEQIVDLRRSPAKTLKALVAITPHGVQRIAQPVQHHAGRTGHDKPEQRSEHRIAAVLQHRLGGCAGHFGSVQLSGLATDQITDPLTCFDQIITAQRLRHWLNVLAQAAHAQRAIQRQNLEQPAHARQPAQQRGQQRQRHNGNDPGGDAVTAPAAAATVETLLDPTGEVAERHQRMPSFRLTEQRIQRDPGDAQQRHTH